MKTNKVPNGEDSKDAKIWENLYRLRLLKR